MHPIIFEFGKFKLHSYGLMLFFAFLVGIIVANKRAKERGLGDTIVLDLSTLLVVTGLAGARALYVITHIGEFRGRYWDIINPIQSTGQIGFTGLVLLGGIIAGFIATALFAYYRKLNFLGILDLFAPSVAVGIGIGRIGCFFHGCCFGKPTELPWGIVFPAGSPAGSVFPHLHIHPTQLYATLYNVGLMFFLLWVEKKIRNFPGAIWSVFMIGYGVLRFLNEMIRWHEPELHAVDFAGGGFLTISQMVSLGMILAGILLYYFARKHYITKPGK